MNKSEIARIASEVAIEQFQKQAQQSAKLCSQHNKPWPCIKCAVMMTMVNDDYCKCPVCGTEVWFEYNSPTGGEIAELMRDMRPNHQPKPALPAGEAVSSGGSSKSRRKKQPNKKPPLSVLNSQLYNA